MCFVLKASDLNNILENQNNPLIFCHRDVPTIHKSYCVSNPVDYAKKNDVYQRLCQLN